MAEVDNTCPRCGGAFHCGFDDAAPCACASVQLDDATRRDLRQRYAGCLCMTCLCAVAAAEAAIEPVR
ncbi:MAG: cysteine-rich CWC family protein [Pseudomonadota bacterium]